MDKKEINDLVKNISNGDIKSFDVLYIRMHRIIEAFVYNHIKNKANINDVINDTFLKVIEKSQDKFLFVNCFAWIMTIAKNTAINYDKKNEKEILISDLEELGLRYSNEEGVVEEKIVVEEALNKLKIEEREVLQYKAIDGMSFSEISVIIHKSESATKRLYYSGKEKLKNILKNGERNTDDNCLLYRDINTGEESDAKY